MSDLNDKKFLSNADDYIKSVLVYEDVSENDKTDTKFSLDKRDGSDLLPLIDTRIWNRKINLYDYTDTYYTIYDSENDSFGDINFHFPETIRNDVSPVILNANGNKLLYSSSVYTEEGVFLVDVIGNNTGNMVIAGAHLEDENNNVIYDFPITAVYQFQSNIPSDSEESFLQDSVLINSTYYFPPEKYYIWYNDNFYEIYGYSFNNNMILFLLNSIWDSTSEVIVKITSSNPLKIHPILESDITLEPNNILVCGENNIVFGKNHIIRGSNNKIYINFNNNNDISENNFIQGDNNILGEENNFGVSHNVINGFSNTNLGGFNIISGEFNTSTFACNTINGIGLIADSHFELLTGQYNAPIVNGCFVIGNGADNENRSNLLSISDNDFIYNNLKINTIGADKDNYDISINDVKILNIGLNNGTPLITTYVNSVQADTPAILSIRNIYASGVLTDSSQTIYFTIPLENFININDYRLTTCKINMRTIGVKRNVSNAALENIANGYLWPSNLWWSIITNGYGNNDNDKIHASGIVDYTTGVIYSEQDSETNYLVDSNIWSDAINHQMDATYAATPSAVVRFYSKYQSYQPFVDIEYKENLNIEKSLTIKLTFKMNRTKIISQLQSQEDIDEFKSDWCGITGASDYESSPITCSLLPFDDCVWGYSYDNNNNSTTEDRPYHVETNAPLTIYIKEINFIKNSSGLNEYGGLI